MPKQAYALEPGGPKRLVISWGFNWKNMTVTLDGAEVGRIPDKNALKQGTSFQLPDGSDLLVKLDQSFGNVGLRVLRNGAPLPGSASDPEAQVKAAAGVVYFVGGLTILLSVLAIAGVQFLQTLGLGVGSAVEGAVYVVLGYFTGRRSRIALGLAMALFLLDTVVSFVVLVNAKATPGAGSIVVRIFLFIAMVRGFKAMGQIPARAAAPTNAPPYG